MSKNSLLETDVMSEVLSDSNQIRTHNHFVRKRTLTHLAKLVTNEKHYISPPRMTRATKSDRIITYLYIL